MSHIAVLVFALLIGVVAGLRALTAPAVVSWAAFLGWVDLDNRWLHWLGHPATVTVLTILAVGMLSRAASGSFETLYALRLLAAGQIRLEGEICKAAGRAGCGDSLISPL